MDQGTDEPGAPPNYLEMRDRIVARYPQLSAQLKLIAQFALNNPDQMAIKTVAQLAGQLGVPASSIVRFAKAMGYSGYLEMKKGFSAHLVYRAQAIESPSSAVDGPLTGVVRATAEARRTLSVLEQDFDADSFAQAVDALASAREILVAAQHQSFSLACLFVWRLLETGRRCVLLDNVGGFALRQSRLARPEDAILAISFRPYQPSVVEAAHAHRELGGAVVAITDTPLSPLAVHASALLLVSGASQGGVGTMVGGAVVVEGLAHAMRAEPVNREEETETISVRGGNFGSHRENA